MGMLSLESFKILDPRNGMVLHSAKSLIQKLFVFFSGGFESTQSITIRPGNIK